MGGQDFTTCSPYMSSLSDSGHGPGPLVKHAWGLAAMDKHHLLQDLSSVGLKRLVWRDIAIGAHAHLTIHTRLLNPSHRRLTPLDKGYMPKYHDSARGSAPPGRNNLPYVIVYTTGIEEDKPSIKYLCLTSFLSPERRHHLLQRQDRMMPGR
jgi:hypothetical protein